MVWILAIQPAGDRDAAVARMLEYAKADPRIVVVSGKEANYRLFFCDTPEEADEERRTYAEYKVVSESLCWLGITEKSVTAYQTGEDDSQRRLATFLEWLFKTFAPCRVFDGESGQDLSAIAVVNPDLLLKA